MITRNAVTLIVLSFDKPIPTRPELEVAPIFAPNSTWTAGRNKLLLQTLVHDRTQAQENKFKYIVFADGDMVSLSCKRYPACNPEQSLLSQNAVSDTACCFDAMVELLQSPLEFALVHFFVVNASVIPFSGNEIPLAHYDW